MVLEQWTKMDASEGDGRRSKRKKGLKPKKSRKERTGAGHRGRKKK